MKTIKRRRKENKTDYGIRIKLLKSGAPRVVFRKSDKNLIVQYIVSEEAQDKVVLGLTSKALLKHNWPENKKGSLKSIPAAYLTGYLFGKKIMIKKLETPILDLGMIRNIKKNKAFAFMNGLFDAGVKIKINPDSFPEEERIQGKKMKEDFSAIFKKIKTDIEGKIK